MIDIERLAIIVDLRQMRVDEYIRHYPPLGALLGWQLTRTSSFPTAVSAGLVFSISGVHGARLGFNIVESRVFNPVAAGPEVLAGDGADVALDAFIEVQHHAIFACTLIPLPTSGLHFGRASRPFTFCAR